MNTYTEAVLEAERVAFLNGEERGDVLSWLTGPNVGLIEREWDDE